MLIKTAKRSKRGPIDLLTNLLELVAVAQADGLQELQVGDLRLLVGVLVLERVYEVLDEALVGLVAQHAVVLEDVRGRLGLPLVRRQQRHVDLLVQQRLILLVAEAERLQELVRRAHDDAHALVVRLLVRDLGQVEHNVVHAHVAQQALVVAARMTRHVVVAVAAVVAAVVVAASGANLFDTQADHAVQDLVQLFVLVDGGRVQLGTALLQLLQHKRVAVERRRGRVRREGRERRRPLRNCCCCWCC